MLDLSLSIGNASITESGPAPPLDTYTGAQTCYSFSRKLRTAYSGSAFRIRRSNDNAEQDIGYIGNDIDEGAITTFVGSNSAFVVTAYDNSGNSNDWTQSTAALQPEIVTSGTVVKVGGKIAVLNNASAGLADHASLSVSTSGADPATLFKVVKTSRDASCLLGSNHSSVYVGLMRNGNSGDSVLNCGTSFTIYVDGTEIGDTEDNLHDAVVDDSLHLVSFTNLDILNVSWWTSYYSEYTLSNYFYPVNYEHELIIYDSDKSSDRASIENNIKTYYNIS